MDPTPGAGRYTPAIPARPELLYDRNVHTQVFHGGPDRLHAVATLKDDTLGPHGFATVHEMTLEVTLSRPDLTILDVTAGMEHHPHGTCPMTLRQMDHLVGLTVGQGYFAELSRRFGGNRGCNHLHAMAQSIGTVVALSFAATLTYDHPETLAMTPADWFGNVVDKEPRIVNSCVVWHENGDLVRRLKDDTA